MISERANDTPRLRDSTWSLLRAAAGSPREIVGKARRLVGVLAAYADERDVRERLGRLRAMGLIDHEPSRTQLLAGGLDMMRLFIGPAAADYYRTRGIGFGLHQVLRFLDEPASLADPVGFFSTRDGIIGHLMQVVHANPVYDLELLASHERGLDELEAQLEAMLRREHPRARAIAAIVEEADYHARLLDYVRAWRRDPNVPPMVRANIAASPELGELERMFGTMRGVMRYCAGMPKGRIAAGWRVVRGPHEVSGCEGEGVSVTPHPTRTPPRTPRSHPPPPRSPT